MNNYFVAKIKREKIEESGKVKVVTEEYIFDAISWTECEARIAKELAPYFTDYTVKDISRSNYSEVFDTEGESYFKCKISYVTICEEKGTEKKKASYVLVMGDDLKTARENLVEAMSGTIVDYEINSIADTRVEDVFPYSADSVASAIPEHLTEYPATEEECFKIEEDQEVQRPDCTRCENEPTCTSKHKHSKSLINCGDFVFFDRSKISEKD